MAIGELVYTQGGFPYSVWHMAGEGHVWVNLLKPRAPIVFNTEHAPFVDVPRSIVGSWHTVVRCNTFREG